MSLQEGDMKHFNDQGDEPGGDDDTRSYLSDMSKEDLVEISKV